MKKSKLIDVLSTLDKNEIKSFRDFILSPFFNKKKEIIPFFELLVKYFPDFPEEKIERQRIYKKLYPNTDYHEKALGYLMSHLSKLLEQYISYQKYTSDTLMPAYYLMSAYIERDLFKYYRQENKKVQASLGEHKRSSHFLLKKYLLSEAANQYFFLQRKRTQDENLQIVTDDLDLFYITTKLEYSCEMINRKNVLGADYQVHLIDHLEKPLKELPLFRAPLSSIYLHIYQVLQSGVTTENIQTLHQLIQNKDNNFSDDETRKFYTYAINLCLQMQRKGNFEFMQQAHDLYMDGIQKRIFYDNDYLSPWVYTNVIRIGIFYIKKYEDTKKFIFEYNEHLPPEFRENALHFNLAEVFYRQKNYDEAIDHLNQVKFSDIQIHLGSREMLLKIYYETDAEEALLSLIASFSIFLKRNKNMSADIKRPFLNFCDLLNQLMRRNPKKLPAIREKIETTTPVTSRSWLRSTCDAIMKEVGVSV